MLNGNLPKISKRKVGVLISGSGNLNSLKVLIFQERLFRNPFRESSLKYLHEIYLTNCVAGTNLQALIDYNQNPNSESNAEIVLVISNKAGVKGLERARVAGVQTKVSI